MNAKSSETNASNSAKEAEASAVNAKASENKAKEYADNLQASTDDISHLKKNLVANSKEDAKTKSSLSALWALNNGISYRFETDSEKAYKKQIPSGAKLGTVNKIGGKTIVWNQYANINDTEKFWADDSDFYKNLKELSGHKLYIMNKCVVTEILYDNREAYNKRLILFDENDEGTVNVDNTFIKKEDIAVGKVFRNASIVQAPNVLKRIRLYNIGDDEIGLTVKCDSWVEVIDLTKMYGSGNEPSTVEEFEAMFPNGYYPYNEGELMSMSVNNVDVESANLITPNTNFIDRNGYTLRGVTYTYDADKVITINGTFKKEDTGGCFGLIYYRDLPSYGTYTISIFDENNTLASDVKFLTSTNTSAFNYTTENGNIMIGIIPTENKAYTNKKYYIQLVRGATATSYSPYKKETYTISQAILNLDGYGWSSGTAYNYVDFENKKFYKNVERVDLSTLAFVYTAYDYNNNLYGFRSPLPKGIKANADAYAQKNNLLCLKYQDTPWQDAYRGLDKTISQLSQSIQINDSSFDNADKFKDSLKGVYVYYELAEPVVTDISDIIGDAFQEPITVEGGGSLTFKNTNGDGYQLAVPSDIQYVVSLKEVTS